MMNLLRDHTGKLSTMRVTTLIVAASVSLGWLIVSIQKQALQELPSSVIAALGGVLCAKTGQSITEARCRR